MDACLDTAVASFLLSPDTKNDKKGTAYVTTIYLIELDYLLLLDMYDIPATYSSSPLSQLNLDLRCCHKLMDVMLEKLKETEMFGPFMKQEMPLIPTLCRMEILGIGFDVPFLQGFKEKIEQRMAELSEEAHKLAGREFKLTSPQQVSKGIQCIISLLTC
jgi:DNA polymerase I-like protein with 3'-5' exonuclease and polymerase domains